MTTPRGSSPSSSWLTRVLMNHESNRRTKLGVKWGRRPGAERGTSRGEGEGWLYLHRVGGWWRQELTGTHRTAEAAAGEVARYQRRDTGNKRGIPREGCGAAAHGVAGGAAT